MTQYNQNFYQAFAQQIRAKADKCLLITEDNISYSYADIDQESARLANYLSDLGASSGDRISVQVEKSPQAVCLYLACLRAGLVFHPLNPAYQAIELDYFLNNAEPSVVICDSTKLDSLRPIVDAANIQHLLTLDADGTGDLIDESRNCSTEFNCVNRTADDMAALLYSSGTTGVPKGIMLTHENLASNARSLVEAWGFTSEDWLLHALPIFHVHGLFVGLGCVLMSGASMRWLAAFNSVSVVKYLPESTVLMGVPTYYTRLLDDPKFTRELTDNIRLFVSGSAPLLEETFEQFEQRTGQRILERYGMTETNMNSSNPLHGERKAGTVGPPLPGVEIRITDENNNSLAPGEIGNLQVRGPNVFKGYWKLPEKTTEDFTNDGFFNTGDKGRIDEHGYVAIVGRSKDVVITGGLNVYPKEVELVIDDIKGVKESAVIGVPHADFGEAVVAVVVAESEGSVDEAAIIRHTKTQLANFKVPKRVVLVNELPRNAMGKVQKNLLRKDHSDL
ncbi:MAG: malonyl-CoA/methylmalonyl-CoA synthetase [Cryomorphaceae bacterium]